MNRKENIMTELRFVLLPASSDETGLFIPLSKDQDEESGTVSHLRIDFGSNGHEFWNTWQPCHYEKPYSSAFKSDLKMVVDALRADGLLESFNAIQQYCYMAEKSREDDNRITGISWKRSITAIVTLQSYLQGLPGILNGI